MRDNFAILVITNGRPDNVHTVQSLRTAGYTGRVYYIVDDEDPTLDRYLANYGDEVIVFSKEEISQQFDAGDQEPDRRTSVYARNACWQIAAELGLEFFGIFDDDYTHFHYRWVGRKNGNKIAQYHGWVTRRMDHHIESLILFMEHTPTASTVAMAQGGDGVGGRKGDMARIRFKRKAMNSFICRTSTPFMFVGRLNEDVTSYVWRGSTGQLFFTFSPLQLEQLATQNNEGGITDVYRESGTYLKTFYTIMWSPSTVKLSLIGVTDQRLHHRVNWDTAVPKIMHETTRRSA